MRQMGTRRRSVGLALAILASASCVALTGCGASVGKVAFRCGPQINGGLALAVDVVRATEQEARNIQTMGEKWFYDQSRLNFQGQNRIQTLTFTSTEVSGRCDREVAVKVSKGELFLVLIADYKFQATDPAKYVIVLPREKWISQKVLVSVLERELAVETRW